jgi:hypothetical protein
LYSLPPGISPIAVNNNNNKFFFTMGINDINFVRCEVLTAVSVKNTIVRVERPQIPVEVHRCFGGLHLQG